MAVLNGFQLSRDQAILESKGDICCRMMCGYRAAFLRSSGNACESSTGRCVAGMGDIWSYDQP